MRATLLLPDHLVHQLMQLYIHKFFCTHPAQLVLVAIPDTILKLLSIAMLGR